MGRKAGVTEDQLRELHNFESSPHFDDRERLVLRLAAAMSGNPADVPDDLFAALRTQFNERQLVELAAAIAWENGRARFNRVFDVEAQGFSSGQFCALPERD
ncbi:MAG: carboxymuconolactone decarboxylase family protein [Bryobacteraceae bacterium]